MWASLMVQWLRLGTSTVVGVGLIPSWGSSVCCEVQPKRKKKDPGVGGSGCGKVLGVGEHLSKFEGADNEPVRSPEIMDNPKIFLSQKSDEQ